MASGDCYDIVDHAAAGKYGFRVEMLDSEKRNPALFSSEGIRLWK